MDFTLYFTLQTMADTVSLANGWNDIMNNNTKQYETHNKSAQQSDTLE